MPEKKKKLTFSEAIGFGVRIYNSLKQFRLSGPEPGGTAPKAAQMN